VRAIGPFIPDEAPHDSADGKDGHQVERGGQQAAAPKLNGALQVVGGGFHDPYWQISSRVWAGELQLSVLAAPQLGFGEPG
jgi:hypothetical protein